MKPRDKGGTSRERSGETQVRDLTRPLLHEILADARAGTRPDRVRQGLREACEAARGHGLQAEDLLVIVKQSWREVSDDDVLEGQRRRASTPSSATQARSDEALAEVITMCIKEFYRPSERQ